jgi:uncharacterized membrane protein YeaQ/YmgE (transglycosylase-associated protein family)
LLCNELCGNATGGRGFNLRTIEIIGYFSFCSAKEDWIIMPDIINLIIWLIAGVAGGNAAGDLLKGHYDLGLRNTGYGAIGGIVGALILQTLIPALRGIDYGPIIGQLIVAFVSGAVLTVIAGAVTRWLQNRRPNSRG